MKLTLCILLVTSLLVGGPTYASESPGGDPPTTEIDYLLDVVATSQLEFIRNGKTHTPAEAVDHMRRKYDYYEKKIHSAEDFIALAATKSLMSGKPYFVRDVDGETPAGDWLLARLTEYRAQ